ncbi:MAG: D-Ala-D-Ala carboxypeptidase family metallohydrolase [Leptolyngbyaceae bacterium]|nr:D-Ala-D-Ala carboxypeptidase family metallohydrolase [Leptolyngbyaceae bacterium]
MKLTTISDTIFKLRVKPSRELSTSEKLLVSKDSEFDVVSIEAAPEQCLKVTLRSPIGLQSERVWYVLRDHVALLGNEPNNNPSEEDDPELPQDYPNGFAVPGYPYRFYLPDPVLQGGTFTWAEVTKNGQRMPTSKAVVDNILQMADTMQDIRELFGDRPIKVMSWYRSPRANKQVGGSARSFHLTGGAVDFCVSGVTPAEVQQRLGPWWGAQGGLASGSSFTHIDNRGYRARWHYSR